MSPFKSSKTIRNEEPGVAPRNTGQHLELALRAAGNGDDRLSVLLRGHISEALGAYSCAKFAPREVRQHGTLAPWQLHRATTMLRASIDESLPLPQLARECRLSASHFNRAFKKTTGHPPYRWLAAERIRLAESMLQNRGVPLTAIAQQCGFSDQAAFTRSYKRFRGVTPGAARRGLAA